MKKSTPVVIAILAATFLLTASSILADSAKHQRSSCQVWNLTADMLDMLHSKNSVAMSKANKPCSGADDWEFMQSATFAHDPSTYTPLVRFVPNVFGIQGLEIWDGTYVGPQETLQPQANQPFVGINVTGQTQQPLTLNWPAYAVLAHPAPEQMLVIAWHSPINGVVQVTGAMHDLDTYGGDGILWYINKGSTNLASGGYYNWGAQDFIDGYGGENLNAISVNRGDTLYFMLHPNGTYYNDSTRLDITIAALQ